MRLLYSVAVVFVLLACNVSQTFAQGNNNLSYSRAKGLVLRANSLAKELSEIVDGLYRGEKLDVERYEGVMDNLLDVRNRLYDMCMQNIVDCSGGYFDVISKIDKAIDVAPYNPRLKQ